MAKLKEIMVKKIKFYNDENGPRWVCRYYRCRGWGDSYDTRDQALNAAKSHLMHYHLRKKVKS